MRIVQKLIDKISQGQLITRDNVAESSAVRIIVEEHGTIRVPLHPERGGIHFLKEQR